MKPVARVGDKTKCPKHGGGPLKNAQRMCVEANGKLVIRLADYAKCKKGPLDIVVEGAESVTVCGLPVARVGDKMQHGGEIIQGSPNVEVGGPTFSLPRNMTLTGPASFQNKTVRDLYKLSTTPTGQTLLNTFNQPGGPSVTIQPYPATDNSFAQNMGGGNSLVSYNPDVSITGYDNAGGDLGMPPTVVLGHELTHAYNNANGINASGNEPGTGPPSEPNIPIEEEQTIGTGNFTGRVPSENSLRKDLGLQQRADHLGKLTKKPSGDVRPGQCK